MVINRFLRHHFRRLSIGLCALVASAMSLFATPALTQQKQSEWLNPDVIALRDEVAALRREVERLRTGQVVGGSGAGAAPSGDIAVRVDQLSTDTRRLQAEVERIIFETGRALDARDAQIREMAQRLATLEAALNIKPGPSKAGQPGSGPKLNPTQKPPAGAAASSSDVRPPGQLGQVATDSAAGAAAGGALSLEDGLKFIKARDLPNAEAALNGFIQANPSDPRVGEALYWLGETYFLGQQFEKAAQQFLSGFRDHPTNKLAPNSLLRLGVTMMQLKQKESACTVFEQVAVRYPKAGSVLRQAKIQSDRAGCR